MEDEAVRPNLLAVLAVLTGTAGLLSFTCCYGGFLAAPLGAMAVLAGWMARKQAAETGFGADYAWWGIALGCVDLLIGIPLGVTYGAIMVAG